MLLNVTCRLSKSVMRLIAAIPLQRLVIVGTDFASCIFSKDLQSLTLMGTSFCDFKALNNIQQLSIINTGNQR